MIRQVDKSRFTTHDKLSARSRKISQRPRRAPRLLPSGANLHDLISEGCETAVRRPEPTGLIDVAAVDHQGVGVGAPPPVARIALDRP